MANQRNPNLLDLVNTSSNVFSNPLKLNAYNGNTNQVTFHTFPYSKNQFGQPLQVAYSQPLDIENSTDEIAMANAAQELLLAKKISSDFNHIYIFRGANGVRISEKANGNLQDLIDNRAYSVDEMKEIFGQLLLAIEDYESQGLEHRDICTANVLFFKRAGKILIKLADQDNAAEAEEKREISYDDIVYASTDIESLVEECLLPLIENFIAEDDELSPELVPAYNLILEFQTGQTIAQAKQHFYFGENAEQRNEFFSNLRKAAQQNNTLRIDGIEVSQSCPMQDNYFYLLPAVIKPIYNLALEVDKTFDNMQQSLTEKFSRLNENENKVAQVKNRLFANKRKTNANENKSEKNISDNKKQKI